MRGLRAVLPTLLALALPGARPAEACGNAIIFATDHSVGAVKQAEDKLNDGAPAEAAALLQALKQASVVFSRQAHANRVIGGKEMALANRAFRVAALATVRLDGSIGPFGNAKPEQRRQNVLWATRLLEGLDAGRSSGAASKTDYAEALARTNPADAKAMLEELASKDVLATPYAYATLAALRSAAGDTKARDEALAKCKLMAAKQTICVLPNLTS